jgi:hypothetical protein
MPSRVLATPPGFTCVSTVKCVRLASPVARPHPSPPPPPPPPPQPRNTRRQDGLFVILQQKQAPLRRIPASLWHEASYSTHTSSLSINLSLLLAPPALPRCAFSLHEDWHSSKALRSGALAGMLACSRARRSRTFHRPQNVSAHADFHAKVFFRARGLVCAGRRSQKEQEAIGARSKSKRS